MDDRDRLLLNSLPIAQARQLYFKLQVAGIWRRYEERLAAKSG